MSLRGLLVVLSSNFLLSPFRAAAPDPAWHPNWWLVDDHRCGESNADRIVGGRNAALGAYPWIARLKYEKGWGRTSYSCAGSLINDRYVVTAAHCVTGLPKTWRLIEIRLGEHNAKTDPDCEDGYCAEPVQDIQPERIVFHEGYDEPPMRHDVALIRLNRPAVFNGFVGPICLMRGSLLRRNLVGHPAEVAGWGIDNIETLQPSVVLQTLTVPIVERQDCERVFRHLAEIGKGQICAGGAAGEDSCAGDSGGPLMIAEELDGPPKYYFLGIVSFGATICGTASEPGVYTEVANYTRWILDNISP